MTAELTDGRPHRVERARGGPAVPPARPGTVSAPRGLRAVRRPAAPAAPLRAPVRRLARAPEGAVLGGRVGLSPPGTYTIPPDDRIVGDPGWLEDQNDTSIVLTGMGAYLNVWNTAFAGGADPTGTAGSGAAIQAALNAALDMAVAQGDSLPMLTPTVVVPFGNYLIDTPLNFAAGSKAGVRICGTWGSRLFSTSGPIFDFQTKYLEGLEIDHLTLDATGGHVFTNACLKFSWLHHLYLRQNSAAYSVWNQTQASNQLQNTYFTDIRFFVYPDPSTGLRSVPGWNIVCPSRDAYAEVAMTRVNGFNEAGTSGDFDNTQYLISGACSGGSFDYASALTFRDCSLHNSLGGGIHLQSASHVLFDDVSFYDVYYSQGPGIRGVGNSLLKVGTYSGGPPSLGVEFRGCTRCQGTIGALAANVASPGSGPSDMEVSADTQTVLVTGWQQTNYQRQGDGQIQLNGCTGATLMGNDSSLNVVGLGPSGINICYGQILKATYDELIALDSPLASWKLADAVSSGTAADSSGNGWTGTVTSVTFGEAGPIPATATDTGGLFNGTTSKIVTSFNPAGLTAFSFCAWVNMNGATPAAGVSIAGNDDPYTSNNGIRFLLNYSAGAWYPQMYVGNGTVNTNGGSVPALPTTGWHFIAATFASGAEAVKMYVDGVFEGNSAPWAYTVTAGADAMNIGHNPVVFGGQYFPGTIAEVSFLPLTLTPAAITGLYQAALYVP